MGVAPTGINQAWERVERGEIAIHRGLCLQKTPP